MGIREILFRRSHFNYNGVFMCFTYWGKINFKCEIDNECFTSPSQVNGCHSFVDEQFTGLTDKNGTKIFEGDILLNHKQESGIVVFYNSGFYLKCVRRNNSIFYIPLDAGFLLNKSVIGHIHEDK